ncbi:MAG: NAD-dependent epimerase/dehydratase family protein, partial [Flavobacteriales bacterium]
MKKVLVTGGAGYIGSILVRLLLKQNYRVRVMDNLKFGGNCVAYLLSYDNFEFQKGDVRNKKDREKALDGMDAVVNLAAIVG